MDENGKGRDTYRSVQKIPVKKTFFFDLIRVVNVDVRM